MKIKALNAFTYVDGETGDLTSIAFGAVADVDSDLGNQLISEGLAEEYTLISPTGTKTITENGTGIDVAQYATADVNVVPVTLTYNANTGTGTVDPVTVGKGTSVTLDDGSGLTAPTDKTFAGWATTADATEPDATSPFTVTEDVTLYAVWVAEA